MATNLPGFEQYPIAAELTQNFNMPAYVDNDANVAGLAEALVGAGKGLAGRLLCHDFDRYRRRLDRRWQSC